MPLRSRCAAWPYCGQCTCSMSMEGDRCGECAKDPCVCLPQDGEQESSSPSLTRSSATVGHKRPMSQFVDDEAEEVDPSSGEEILAHSREYKRDFTKKLHCDESYSPEADLDAYFDEFGLSAESRIAMCRTYANYLTQKLRSSGRLGPPRPKGKPPVQKRLTWK